MKTSQEISDFTGGILHGSGTVEIHTLGSLEHAQAGALAYADERYLDDVASTEASCVLVPKGNYAGKTVIVVDQPRVAFANIAQWLFPTERPFEGIHPSVVVSDTAELGDDVSIGAWTVVEPGAQIGEGTVVFPGCYIGRNCRIGRNCVLYPQVVLYPDVLVGDHVVLHAGTVLGADGFGFVFDGARQVKVPQIGRLRVGSDVEIGANTCVDRGALDNTTVADGVKIDNLCQIAHNVSIGAHSTVSSQTGIAGSSQVGDQAVIGGQVGIADHCRIDDHAVVGAQCGVPSRKRIPKGEVYWGTPARPLKDVKIQQAHLSRLPKLTAEMKQLRADLAELRSRLDAQGT